MPAATLVIASLAALEPPRIPPQRPFAILQTSWSLTASPSALLAAQDRPIYGPGQVMPPIAPPPPATPERKREVTVLPATEKPADELENFDELKDPAAPAVTTEPAASDAAAGSATTEVAPTDAAATAAADAAPADAAPAADPLEDELAQQIKPDSDPLEPINRVSFAISMVFDKLILRPVALTYLKVAPKPLRDGMRNILSHWGAPIIFANDLLQLKPKRAIRTVGRFLINTLLGIGGLFDVAKGKRFNLPHHGNRFSNTLAMYGVKPGPYFYFPILGPTTLRDQLDRVQGYVPGIDNPVFRNGRGSVFGYLLGLEDRATSDQDLKALLEDSVDPYATFRTTWLQDRQGEVERLKAPDGKEPGSVQSNPLDTALDDPLIDPAAPAADPTAKVAPEAAPSEPAPVESATPAP